MDDDPQTQPQDQPRDPASDGPQPEPIRFFGTTWVAHDGGYALRRAGVAAGALAAAAAGAFLLRFGFQGLSIAKVGTFVGLLVVVAFAVCSALAFRKTWEGFTRRPEPGGRGSEAAASSAQGILLIGFIGTLLAYFVRALIEAPGEKLHRAEYERARELHTRRRDSRTGNPATRATGKKRKRG
ncbi:hypothetical protein QMK19_32650 [Streptomyces sp. H10-C2]|uniref:hypothetical protein n=1 Tax=unclassified Streptomyces TaxID=2593676 RepID=UPI0024B88114|nr:MULTISPECIES: hypothetical protein [unclassified Streptomyces]MDJ0345306.1 hypothetical protein [Streptomyces sp. PH10-H1]MDJ0374255.1 hypothetical protein [Streptomyces sp. H10-C2]